MTTEALERRTVEDAAQAAEEFKRVYIFHPEEPFLLLYRGGRMLRFNNGRLISTTLQENGRPLGEDDIAWFRYEADRTERQTGEPRFVIWEGELTDTARGILMLALSRRITRQVITRAHGADAATMANDVELAMQMLLASEDGLPDIRTHRMGNVTDVISRLSPSLSETMRGQAMAVNRLTDGMFEGMTTRERMAAQMEDERVIAAAAAGKTGDGDGDELTPPATKNVDPAQGPSNAWGS